MEVHHHPQVEKKGFKEYLLEGLMIFIAVMMGFIAESVREHISDNSREHEYIVSMIQDARTDIVGIDTAISLSKDRILRLDSLSDALFDYKQTKNSDSILYRLFISAIQHPDYADLTERTISQLNAGGMRLIRKKAAVDSIILYESAAKKLENQQEYYDHYLNNLAGLSETVFNYKYFVFRRYVKKARPSLSGAELLTHDKNQLIQMGNAVRLYEGIVSFYAARLRETKTHAANLSNTLKKEYKIDNE